MVTYQTDIGDFQLIHNITLPQEFIGYPEVAEVSAVDNKVDIIPFIKMIDKIYSLIIPPL